MNFAELLAAFYLMRELYVHRAMIMEWIAAAIALLRQVAGNLFELIDPLFASLPLRLAP